MSAKEKHSHQIAREIAKTGRFPDDYGVAFDDPSAIDLLASLFQGEKK